MSYGADCNYMYRHAALYVDKILNGKNRRTCPSSKRPGMSWRSNLKTAKALGLEIPPTVLARADVVIE